MTIAYNGPRAAEGQGFEKPNVEINYHSLPFGSTMLAEGRAKIKIMEFPKDVNGKTVKIGDKVKGEGFIKFQDGWKVDRTPIVEVREENGVLYFGWLSAKSFNRFWIVEA